ncbi:hypothetical protein CY34DRAFT_627607 [Suillus luteus UH-Slu-Lm8-n1]|uniref:Uncharacterized protein n=1 Tax=Suillus luteus UH-Slu-Lm8-n1 TaxID=930992 RepID=A0A0D0B3C8_9AGAM|nr:hypothetical protein CY34DRAFT_627607 [Suillus luteus UH-Slu-Lm8-n1]
MGICRGTTVSAGFRAVVDSVPYKRLRSQRTQVELFCPHNAHLDLCRTLLKVGVGGRTYSGPRRVLPVDTIVDTSESTLLLYRPTLSDNEDPRS